MARQPDADLRLLRKQSHRAPILEFLAPIEELSARSKLATLHYRKQPKMALDASLRPRLISVSHPRRRLQGDYFG